jgi:hypothetical protein
MTSSASCRRANFVLTGRLERRSKLIRIAASPLSGCKADTFDPERIIFGPQPGRPLLPALKLLQRLRGDTFQRFARFVRLPEIGERRGDKLVRGGYNPDAGEQQ